MVKCKKCNSVINDGYSFCLKCGTKVGLTTNSITKTKVSSTTKNFIPITIQDEILDWAVIGTCVFLYSVYLIGSFN